MSRHPEVLWAQRSSSLEPEKNIIYLTINVPDILESSLQYTLTATSLSFKATAAGTEQVEYAFDLEFYAEVNPEVSTRRLTSRSLVAVLRKKEAETEYWPRLTKEKIRTPFIKTDFSKWVDEDEQDGNPSLHDDFDGGVGGIPGMQDFDLSQMGAGGGFGGAPATNEDESDDDDGGLPPLEDPEPAK